MPAGLTDLLRLDLRSCHLLPVELWAYRGCIGLSRVWKFRVYIRLLGCRVLESWVEGHCWF